jgi:hypothetical protein
VAKVKARESALLVLQAEDVAPERGVTGNFRNAAWAPRDLQAYETLGKAKVKLILNIHVFQKKRYYAPCDRAASAIF